MDMAGGSAATASKRTPMIVGGIIVLAALAAGGYYWSTQDREKVREIAPNTNLVTAAGGKVVGNFPTDLILEKDAPLVESYRVDNDGQGIEQPVVVYVSGRGLQENIQAFRLYFLEKGWELIEPGNSADALATSIFATKDKEEAHVALKQMENGKIEVTIAYLSNQ